MKIIASFLSLLFFNMLSAQTLPVRAKNVLIIYSDDQSYHALGIMGNNEVKTPNIDKLARKGMMFTQAHVMGGHQGAICIPSRVMLMTGRLVNRLPRDGSTIPDSLVTLPEVLRSKGYTTFHTGKWHSDRESHHRMFSNGGDIFFGGMHFNKDGGQEHPRVVRFDASGNYPSTAFRNSDTFSTTLYADNAIKFLNSNESKGNPFFCYVAFTSPHDPRTPPSAYAALYDADKISIPKNFLPQHPFDNGDLNVRDEKLLPRPLTHDAVKKDIASYYGMVSEMDAQVGRIIAALEKNGLMENTLIVFAGDNGLAVGQHGLLGKQNLYEHSIRVPMIMAGPGIKENSSSSAFVYLSDIAPTIYEYLGVRQPSIVEAKSLMTLINKRDVQVRKNIYNVYGHWSRSVKSDDGFKLIVYNVDGKVTQQLFNLHKDPWEVNDLSGDPSYVQKISQMRTLLKKEMIDAYDDLDIDQPDWGRKPTQKGRGS